MFGTTVHGQTRMGIAAQENKGIGFVITQQYVVARLIELNVIVFKQQRFRLGVRHGDINILYQCDQRFGLTGGQIAAEIAGKAFFEIFCLTHIDNRTASVIHAIDAWLAGHGFQKCF